jgi:hypothetical protein
MNECSDCGHHFTDAEAGKDFDESLKPYSCCPVCGSDDYSEPEFKVPPPITVKPVSTKALEAQAKRMLARLGEDVQ